MARDLQESQSSVNVSTGLDIEERQITDLEDVLFRTPNISLFGGGGYSIRGIPDRGLGSGVGDTSLTTAIYVDGAVQSLNGGLNGIQSTWDLQQIEIYRGPQTTSLGRSALAGSIVVRSNDPEFEWEQKARIGLSENNGSQVAFTLGGPVTEDSLAFRLSVESNKTDGFTEYENAGISVDDVGRDNHDLLRGKLLYEPGDQLSVLYTLTSSEAEDGNDFVTGADPFDATRDTVVDIIETDVISQIIEITYQFSDELTLVSTTSFTDLESETSPIEATLAGDGTIVNSLSEDHSTSQEFRLEYAPSESWRGTVGLYLADLSEKSERQIGGTVTIPGTGTFNLDRRDGYNNDFQNIALFGEVEHDLSDRWTLIAGGRYDKEDADRSEFASTSVTPDTGFFPVGETDFDGDSSFDAFLPKLGAIYNFNEASSLSLTIQRAYRPGGVDIRPDDNEETEFDPEFTNNLDLAYRSLLMNGDLVFNVNYFQIEYTDMQVRFAPDPAAPFVRFIDNAGEASLSGFEIETSYRLNDSWQIFASLATIESELKDFEFQGITIDDQDFPNAADLSGSFGFTYQHPNGLSVTLDNIYSGDYYTSLTGEDESQVDSYLVTNLRVGYDYKNWRFNGFALNLLDE
ncbi:MAG: TonB-dependent receptor, partial [Pseudomonadota bacterium]